jgi:hypothetical protein
LIGHLKGKKNKTICNALSHLRLCNTTVSHYEDKIAHIEWLVYEGIYSTKSHISSLIRETVLFK